MLPLFLVLHRNHFMHQLTVYMLEEVAADLVNTQVEAQDTQQEQAALAAEERERTDQQQQLQQERETLAAEAAVEDILMQAV
jgi:cell division protein FtsB